MPTGIQLSSGVVVGSPKPIDAKYGPYDTVALALADLTSDFRYQGLTVGIKSGSSIVEYWFKDGVENANFVEKMSAANWDTLLNKPTTFAPATHPHQISEVTGLQNQLDARPPFTVKEDVTVLESTNTLLLDDITPPNNATTRYFRIVLNGSNATGQLTIIVGTNLNNTTYGKTTLRRVLDVLPSGGTRRPYRLVRRNFVALNAFSDQEIVAYPAANFPSNIIDTVTLPHNTGVWMLGTEDWLALINKPSTFPPSAHTHTASAITDFATAVAAAAPGYPGYVGEYDNGADYGIGDVVSTPVGSPYGSPGQLFIRVGNPGNPGYPPGTSSWSSVYGERFQPNPETLPDVQSGVTVTAPGGQQGGGADRLLLSLTEYGGYSLGDAVRTFIDRIPPSQAPGGASNMWLLKQEACGSEDCTTYFEYVSTSSGVFPWLATWPEGVSVIKAQLPRVALAALSPTGNEGTSSYVARADHSHPFPTALQVGAAPAIHSHADATTSTAGFLSAAGKSKLDASLDSSLFADNRSYPVPINNTGKLLYSVLPKIVFSNQTFSPSGIKNGYLAWLTEFTQGFTQQIFFAPSTPSLTWTDASPPAGTPSIGGLPSGGVWFLTSGNATTEYFYGVALRDYVSYDNIGTSPSGQPTAAARHLRGGIVPVEGTSETRRVRQFVVTAQAATLAYVIDYPQTGDPASGPEQLELWYANARSPVNGAFQPFSSNSILYRRVAVLGPTTDFTFGTSPSFRVVQNVDDSETGVFVSRGVVASRIVTNVGATSPPNPTLYPVWNTTLGVTKLTEVGVLDFPASAGLVLSSVEPTFQNEFRTLEWKDFATAVAAVTQPFIINVTTSQGNVNATNYINGAGGLGFSNNSTSRYKTMLQKCVIRKANVVVQQATAQTLTPTDGILTLMNITTGADYLIINGLTADNTNNFRNHNVTNLNIPMEEGDVYQFRLNWPTTVPTQIRIVMDMFCYPV